MNASCVSLATGTLTSAILTLANVRTVNNLVVVFVEIFLLSFIILFQFKKICFFRVLLRTKRFIFVGLS